MVVRRYFHPANANCEAEFRDAIARMIPSPIKLLEEVEEDIRSEIVRLISRLEKYSERSFNGIAT